MHIQQVGNRRPFNLKVTPPYIKEYKDSIFPDRYANKAELAPFRNEYLKIICRGVGLETNPRNVYDLFINVAVLTYRMFQK